MAVPPQSRDLGVTTNIHIHMINIHMCVFRHIHTLVCTWYLWNTSILCGVCDMSMCYAVVTTRTSKKNLKKKNLKFLGLLCRRAPQWERMLLPSTPFGRALLPKYSLGLFHNRFSSVPQNSCCGKDRILRRKIPRTYSFCKRAPYKEGAVAEDSSGRALLQK